MNEAEEVVSVPFVADGQAAEVLQPGNETLHFPAATVTAQRATVLSSFSHPSVPMRRNHFNALAPEFCIEWVTVIGFVANKPLGQGA